jgi:hypothetical protein
MCYIAYRIKTRIYFDSRALAQVKTQVGEHKKLKTYLKMVYSEIPNRNGLELSLQISETRATDFR